MERYPYVNDDFDLFDDVFGIPMFGNEPLMRTDVSEKDGQYVMKMDLPGYDKKDIRIALLKGNLTITAEHQENGEEKDSKGTVLRQERFSGKCSRTFYVGKNIEYSDVKASFKDGTLTVTVPEKKDLPKDRFIEIN